MKRPSLEEVITAAALTILPCIGYGSDAAVKHCSNNTRGEVQAVCDGIQLNSYIWGNGSIDPSNKFTQAMEDAD